MALDLNDPATLRWYLAWYLMAGVDEAIDDPVGRRQPATLPTVPAPAMPVPTDRAVAPGGTTAAEMAAACRTLDELRAAVERFEGCAFKAAATTTVFADGNPAAPLMLIGEAPGREEDLEGLPFVGRSGQLLDRMLAAIGRDRGSAYITNVIFWRPPENRSPSDDEVLACQPFVLRHIALVNPQVVVAVGGIAAKALFRTTQGITRLRGQWQGLVVEGHTYPATALFHPAYLLRSPQHKREAWRDLLAIRARLEAP